jgi:transposase
MEYGAIDLHTRHSQIRIVNEEGHVMLERRVGTSRAELEGVFGGRAALPILVESSTESEWVAQTLEALGHTVIVADPNYLAMYGARSRKVKTDKRDVAALAAACRRGTYRPAHRASAAARALRRTLRVRRQLVRQRSALIHLLRAQLRQEGIRLASGSAERVLQRVARVALPKELARALAPLRHVLRQLTRTLTTLETQLATRARGEAVTQRLMSAPGVGPVVALTFQAVLDAPARFGGSAARVSAFVGVVPQERSSGERRRLGAITKTGPGDLRALLVQASWGIWRGTGATGAALRTWAHAVAARRGRRIAVVALARRLTRIVYALWRDGTVFQEPRRAAVQAG